MMRICVLLIGLCLLGCSIQTPPSFDAASQYINDTTAIRSYLKKNNINATKLSQGVWFIIDSAANGIRPTFSDTTMVSYKMKLLADESIVDQSVTPTTFILSQLILGVRNVLPFYQQGSKGRIFIPSFFGYQNVTNGAVPANSNLIFEFKLNNVKDGRLKNDTATIRNYLQSHSISASSDISGLRYTIDSLGTGPKPVLTDSIAVTYATKDLATRNVIDQETNPTRFLLSDLVLGWQIALPNVPEGSKVTMYVPSSLTWVPGVTYTTPAFSNLIFNVQLKKVIRH